MKCSKIICILMLGVIFLFTACSCSSNNVEYDDPYSREAVEYYSSKMAFGGGWLLDVQTVVLQYIYNNDELEEKYGKDFCVSDCGGWEDSETFFFLWLNRGKSVYFVDIGNDTWTVKVEKSYFGKWEVTDFYQGDRESCQEDTGLYQEET